MRNMLSLVLTPVFRGFPEFCGLESPPLDVPAVGRASRRRR